MPGLGRGAPGTDPGRPGVPGRGALGPLGRGPPGRCIPVVLPENGLLPGRGPPGRAPPPAENGLLPGRGPLGLAAGRVAPGAPAADTGVSDVPAEPGVDAPGVRVGPVSREPGGATLGAPDAAGRCTAGASVPRGADAAGVRAGPGPVPSPVLGPVLGPALGVVRPGTLGACRGPGRAPGSLGAPLGAPLVSATDGAATAGCRISGCPVPGWPANGRVLATEGPAGVAAAVPPGTSPGLPRPKSAGDRPPGEWATGACIPGDCGRGDDVAALAVLTAVVLAGDATGMASRSLRTTGASTVEDAERTNSPISLSLANTALLSTPSSLASSYTRTLATLLLTPARGCRAVLARVHAHR